MTIAIFARKIRTNGIEDLVERLDFRDTDPEVIDLSPEGGVVRQLKESMIDCVTSEKVSLARAIRNVGCIANISRISTYITSYFVIPAARWYLSAPSTVSGVSHLCWKFFNYQSIHYIPSYNRNSD